MKATIKKYVLRTCKGANGSFQVLDIFVDVVNDKNEVRTYRGQMGAEYAKKILCILRNNDQRHNWHAV